MAVNKVVFHVPHEDDVDEVGAVVDPVSGKVAHVVIVPETTARRGYAFVGYVVAHLADGSRTKCRVEVHPVSGQLRLVKTVRPDAITPPPAAAPSRTHTSRPLGDLMAGPQGGKT